MRELVEAQRRYFRQGHTRPIEARKQVLGKLHRLLLENEKYLADAIFRDFGKSFYLTVENELSLSYGEINTAIRHLRRWASPVRYRTNLVNFPARSMVMPVPRGVSLVMAPWNYPYMLSLVPAVSSLAAGNTVILKPSEVTAHSSAALANLINSNFPEGLFYVQEGGAETASALLEQQFDKIFFTGSTRVGRIVMEAAARNLTPVTLELGGKNPVIVMPDCNLKMAARKITWGKFHNNGAACVSPDHIFVHEEIREELVREIRTNIVRIFGDDARKSIALPRLASEKEYDRIASLIDPSRVVHGGAGDRGSLYIEPTVMDGVGPGDEVMQQEVFGPVMPLLPYRNIEEVTESIRNGPEPLAIYIFTENTSMAKKMLRELPSGGGMVNEVVLHFINMNTPFGGVGRSGMGRYHGKAGFDTFSHYKTLLIKPSWFDLFLKYPPYRESRLRLYRAVLGRSLKNFWH